MRIELMRCTARSLELVDLIAELEDLHVERRSDPRREPRRHTAFDLALSELRHQLEEMKRALLDVPPPRVLDEEVRSTR